VPLAEVLALATVAVMITSCGVVGHDCLALPCPLPLALTIDVTAQDSGAHVNGAVVRVSGPVMTTMTCNQTCYLPGYAGTYVLDVEAPGFQSAHHTITVDGTTPDCGCPTTAARHVSIVLAASP